MTGEENLHWLNREIETWESECKSKHPIKEALYAARKTLEQEPVLDKIRAEIEQNAYPIVHGVNNHELGMTLHGILQVIDKYKAESEGKE